MYTEETKKDEKGKKSLTLFIEGKEFDWHEQYITGVQLKNLANLSLEEDIFLSIDEPWKDELIKNDDKVDLARPGIEYFYIKKKLKFILDGQKFEWDKQYIRGVELRKLGNITDDYDIYLKINGPWEDELVKDIDKIDLARPGIEHFYSKLIDIKVLICINNIPHEVLKGIYTVIQIKEIGKVDPAHELEQLIDGKLTPLDDNSTVEILGGENFFSHVRDGSSADNDFFPQNQIDELKKINPSLSLAQEGGNTYIFLKNLQLPDGCEPSIVEALLCPNPRDGYQSRLFLSNKITGNGSASLNWNSTVRILDRTWHAFSWQTRPGLRLTEKLIIHLNALRKR